MDFPSRILLASASPRRQRLLGALGLEFKAVPSNVDESIPHGIAPRAFAISMADQKAEAVAAKLNYADESLVIGADTIVVLDGRILGKPVDRADAARMLRALSGRTHTVITGLAIKQKGASLWLDAEETKVTFRPLSEEWIREYVGTGSADDKAGAYGVQEMTAKFIERVDGDLSNVVGLPLSLLRAGLIATLAHDPTNGASLRDALQRAFPDLPSLDGRLVAGVPD